MPQQNDETIKRMIARLKRANSNTGDDAARLIEDLWAEAKAWRDHAEDSHDTNYGHCRPRCSKCASKSVAWNKAAKLDTTIKEIASEKQA